jgi:hypothetical protein
MWSDRTPPERVRGLVAGLSSVMPRAVAHRPFSEPLPSEPGFCLLGDRLFHGPLTTVFYEDGQGFVAGPCGTVTLRVRAFELLQAMLEAWRGYSGAVLAGFLSYDLAAEIEDLGPAPPVSWASRDFILACTVVSQQRRTPGKSPAAALKG